MSILLLFTEKLCNFFMIQYKNKILDGYFIWRTCFNGLLTIMSFYIESCNFNDFWINQLCQNLFHADVKCNIINNLLVLFCNNLSQTCDVFFTLFVANKIILVMKQATNKQY